MTRPFSVREQSNEPPTVLRLGYFQLCSLNMHWHSMSELSECCLAIAFSACGTDQIRMLLHHLQVGTLSVYCNRVFDDGE